jgi:hypothetical protein
VEREGGYKGEERREDELVRGKRGERKRL